MNNQYELNKNLVQMLKGGVIMDITFDEPVRAPAPGQSAVLYDENGCIICAGIIETTG